MSTRLLHICMYLTLGMYLQAYNSYCTLVALCNTICQATPMHRAPASGYIGPSFRLCYMCVYLICGMQPSDRVILGQSWDSPLLAYDDIASQSYILGVPHSSKFCPLTLGNGLCTVHNLALFPVHYQILSAAR